MLLVVHDHQFQYHWSYGVYIDASIAPDGTIQGSAPEFTLVGKRDGKHMEGDVTNGAVRRALHRDEDRQLIRLQCRAAPYAGCPSRGAAFAGNLPPMKYVSTRGQAPVLDFAGALLAGLAEDGGLYVPETWPHLAPQDWRALRGLPYPALAARVMQPFVGDAMPFATLEALCHDAYAGFGHPAVVPLIQLETELFVQELFHGPTLAFKDMALQLLGRLFDHILTARDQRVTIVGATSGDTGSAAIEACAGRARVDIVILHPQGRTSEVQRRQMTTVHGRQRQQHRHRRAPSTTARTW